MKKIVSLILITLIVFCLTGCKNNSNSDALKFKEEYELLNDKKNNNGVEYRTVNINKNNPFVYAQGEDIVKMIEEGKTFYVYFGSSYCPWCRSVIEKLIEVANEEKIEKIYYVNIWDGDHNEILRDIYRLNDEGIPELIYEGDESYSKLLKYFDNVLNDYTLTDEKGKSVAVGEKRLFAPNFIYVKDGKAIKLVEGISSNQKGSRDKLTDEILTDEENIFLEFFKN